MEDKITTLIDESTPILEFLGAVASCFTGEDTYYYNPYIFKEESAGKLELVEFKDAPAWVTKEIIKNEYAPPVSLWVKVEDRLPEIDPKSKGLRDTVLAEVRSNAEIDPIYKAYLHSGLWTEENGMYAEQYGIKIIEWRYLPTPPLT